MSGGMSLGSTVGYTTGVRLRSDGRCCDEQEEGKNM
jgi:hypothetical protein